MCQSEFQQIYISGRNKKSRGFRRVCGGRKVSYNNSANVYGCPCNSFRSKLFKRKSTKNFMKNELKKVTTNYDLLGDLFY